MAEQQIIGTYIGNKLVSSPPPEALEVPSELSDLQDIDTTGVTDGDVLAYDSGTWVASNEYVTDGDSRLTDARTPTSHGNEAHDVDYVSSSDVGSITKLTQAQYDALTPQSDVLYVIVEDD